MAASKNTIEFSFYPGCSLATSAKESLESLVQSFDFLGIKLIELEDWNCCGSSSAHSLDRDLGLELSSRNLSLATPDRPLLVACPSCYKNLRWAHHELNADPRKRGMLERRWGRPIPQGLEIVNLLEIIHFIGVLEGMGQLTGFPEEKLLSGLKVAPYYGCMLAEPAPMRRAWKCHGLLERILETLGAQIMPWTHKERCCGTFLTASRPDIAGPTVNSIMDAAVQSGADCVVTACAMCQLNLEIRCNLDSKIPTLHFSEAMSLGMGAQFDPGWLARHLVDPKPILEQMGLL